MRVGLEGTVLKIHPSANIHPSAILEGDVEIGEHTVIGANAYLKGPLTIGSYNQISHSVMIGIDPEHKTQAPAGIVKIGNNNVICEFSIVQRGIGDRDTEIQDNCYIMAHAYIAHDCLIESDVMICGRVSLSGHCHVLKGATLGLASSYHHYSTVGSYAFVGMGSVVVKDIPPFCLVMGNPARFSRYNLSALKELNIPIDALFIENGFLYSTHPLVQECLTNFEIHVRRKVVSIVSLKS